MNGKRLTLLGSVALSVILVPSLALAGPSLYEIPPVSGTTTEGRAITPDGKYVVGSGDSEGFIWDATNGSRQVNAEGALAKDLVGVGYRTYDYGSGPVQDIIAFGTSTAGPYATYYYSSDQGATWGPKLRRTNINGEFPVANGLAGSSLQADAWYSVWDGSGATGQLWVEKGSGAPALPQQDTKGVTTESRILGVSSTGLAVGWRKDGSGNHQGYVLQHDGDGGTSGNTFPLGLQGNRFGQLWTISADSDGADNRAGGMSPQTGKTGTWPYILDDFNVLANDTGTATELPTFNPGAAFATNGIVYGLSADGRYAVGMDFTNGLEKAVLWDLDDLGNIVEIDLTQFAIDHGIIGDFGGNLRRAYSVGVNASNQPVITGWGYDSVEGAVRGFVLTVPEPASLVLLALGGLAMIRRRR